MYHALLRSLQSKAMQKYDTGTRFTMAIHRVKTNARSCNADTKNYDADNRSWDLICRGKITGRKQKSYDSYVVVNLRVTIVISPFSIDTQCFVIITPCINTITPCFDTRT